MFSRTGIPVVLLCLLSVTTESQKTRWQLVNGVIFCDRLGAAILDLLLQVVTDSIESSTNARPQKRGCSRWNFVAI